MGQTLSKMLLHVVFSTRKRKPWLHNEIRRQLFAYIAALIEPDWGSLLVVNGTQDHLHLLVDMRTRVAPAQMVRRIKSNSSRWIRETFPEARSFAWQFGYGIFSVSPSHSQRISRYIENQEAHHQHQSFKNELELLMSKMQIEYDARYLWD